MAKVKGHLGIAQFSRPCPICGLLIKAGSRIAKQMVDGKVLWMHEGCWTPGGPSRYTRSLDRQFRQVVGGDGGG
jgi:hypothetical protein